MLVLAQRDGDGSGALARRQHVHTRKVRAKPLGCSGEEDWPSYSRLRDQARTCLAGPKGLKSRLYRKSVLMCPRRRLLTVRGINTFDFLISGSALECSSFLAEARWNPLTQALRICGASSLNLCRRILQWLTDGMGGFAFAFPSPQNPKPQNANRNSASKPLPSKCEAASP